MKKGLSVNPVKEKFVRSQGERRQNSKTPPDGLERRLSNADRRSENNLKYLSIIVSGQKMGIQIHKVQEVLPPQELTPVPKSHQAVDGLMNLRGLIVTAVNLKKRLGLKDDPLSEKARFIIVEESGELYSLLVDEVGEVMDIAKSRFLETPSMIDDIWKECSEGVFQLNEGLLIALDIAKVINFAN